MIHTKAFHFTKTTYFKIIVTQYFKQRWWIFGWLLIIALIALFTTQNTFLAANILSIAVLFGIAMLLIFWLYANSYKRKQQFQTRYYIITEDWLETRLEDGSSPRFELKYLKKIVIDKNYYLLYIAKDQFFYIPSDSFSSDDDMILFEEIIGKLKI